MKNTQNKKKNIYKIFAIIFILCAVICIGIMCYHIIVQKNANNTYQKLAQNTTETTEDTENYVDSTEGILKDLNIPVPDKNLDWDAIKSENEDIYAWIYIPNTNVDYPILQHPTDDSYYLEHNLDGSTGYPGCIYSESVNKKDFSDANTVLYGHNMKDGSMFASLHNFEDNQFFEDNCFIYIYTPEKTYVYEVYTACEFSDEYLQDAYDFDTESGFDQFVQDIENIRDMTSHRRDGIGMAYGRKLLTLSTCIGSKPDNRWLVVGVLLNEN